VCLTGHAKHTWKPVLLFGSCVAVGSTSRIRGPMRYRLLLPSLLTLTALGLAACGNDSATAPTQPAEPVRGGAEMAVTSNSWITRAALPASFRAEMATATVTNAAGQSVVYSIGGVDAIGNPRTNVAAYNVATNTWTSRRALPRPLASTNGAGVINGKIYVSGGYSSRDDQFSWRPWLYMYDPATNTWTRKRDLPAVTVYGLREYAAGEGVTGVIGGKLYVASHVFVDVGDPSSGLDRWYGTLFLRYKPGTDEWVRLPEPFATETEAVRPTGGGVIDGKFYLMGATTEDRGGRLAVYDPATDEWTTRTPLRLGRPSAGSAVLGGKLYVMGGSRYNAKTGYYDLLDVTIAYDPSKDTWTPLAPLPSPRDRVSATRVFLNGKARIELVGWFAPGNNLQYVP